MTISIIVPVLNEADGIHDFLRNLRSIASRAEIVVVDGGSSDDTPEIARPLCDRLLTSERGRAIQMNTGARVATGDVFWFLHADVQPPIGSLPTIEQILSESACAGGFFRIRLPGPELVYRLTDSFAHYAGRLLRMRCGDHGFFCRRAVFEQIDGFPEVPLMEDVEFFRALRRRGRVRIAEPRLIVSPRRYEQVGPRRVTLGFGFIAALYLLHLPWPVLARLYRRLWSPPPQPHMPEAAFSAPKPRPSWSSCEPGDSADK